MAISFDHMVKYNGKYYPANTPIEEAAKKGKKADKKATDDQKGTDETGDTE